MLSVELDQKLLLHRYVESTLLVKTIVLSFSGRTAYYQLSWAENYYRRHALSQVLNYEAHVIRNFVKRIFFTSTIVIFNLT